MSIRPVFQILLGVAIHNKELIRVLKARHINSGIVRKENKLLSMSPDLYLFSSIYVIEFRYMELLPFFELPFSIYTHAEWKVIYSLISEPPVKQHWMVVLFPLPGNGMFRM